MTKHSSIVLILLLKMLDFQLSAQNNAPFPLYEGKIPNSIPSENREKTAINEWKIPFTTETSEPTLQAFFPEKPNGQAIVICPGGAYVGAAGLHEGTEVAEYLTKKGITAFVLKYRIPDDRYCYDKRLAPLQDAQQALRTVRKNAIKWNINTRKVGIMGFSAGGHLAATASTQFEQLADFTLQDTTSIRPDFSVLIYAVISFQDSLTHAYSRERLLGLEVDKAHKDLYSNELQVNKRTPPCFLVHAQDDDAVLVDNSIEYYQACTKHKVKAEMHLFPNGGHGFGMVNPTTKVSWMELLLAFLDKI
jgi:acetyl esterase/lipase